MSPIPLRQSASKLVIVRNTMRYQAIRQNWEVFVFVLLSIFLCSIYFVGYQGMDDFHYVYAVEKWLRSPPFIGENHWHNRLPLVLSIAASFQIFGKSEFSLVLPNILIFLIFLIFYRTCICRWFGRSVGNTATLLMLTTPLFSMYMSIAYPVIIETCFVITAYFLFMRLAFESDDNKQWLVPILAGAFIAIAFLNRQTAAAGVIALVPIFLMSLRQWKKWFVSGFSFVAVVLLEYLWYWHVTGNIFNRYFVDTEGHRTPTAQLKGGTFEGSPILNLDLMSRWVPSGTFDVHWIINPYIDLFTTASYGLLFWVAVPGVILVLRFNFIKSTIQKNILIAFMILAIIWFFVTVYVLSLRPQARYFGPILAIAPIFASLALNYLLSIRRKKSAIIIMFFVVVINLSLAYARERPLELERDIAQLISTTTEPVYMAAEIYNAAEFFLDVRNSYDNIVVGAGPAGSLQLIIGEESTMNPAVVNQKFYVLKKILDTSGLSNAIPAHLLRHLYPKRPVPILERK